MSSSSSNQAGEMPAESEAAAVIGTEEVGAAAATRPADVRESSSHISATAANVTTAEADGSAAYASASPSVAVAPNTDTPSAADAIAITATAVEGGDSAVQAAAVSMHGHGLGGVEGADNATRSNDTGSASAPAGGAVQPSSAVKTNGTANGTNSKANATAATAAAHAAALQALQAGVSPSAGLNDRLRNDPNNIFAALTSRMGKLELNQSLINNWLTLWQNQIATKLKQLNATHDELKGKLRNMQANVSGAMVVLQDLKARLDDEGTTELGVKRMEAQASVLRALGLLDDGLHSLQEQLNATRQREEKLRAQV